MTRWHRDDSARFIPRPGFLLQFPVGLPYLLLAAPLRIEPPALRFGAAGAFIVRRQRGCRLDGLPVMELLLLQLLVCLQLILSLFLTRIRWI